MAVTIIHLKNNASNCYTMSWTVAYLLYSGFRCKGKFWAPISHIFFTCSTV